MQVFLVAVSSNGRNLYNDVIDRGAKEADGCSSLGFVPHDQLTIKQLTRPQSKKISFAEILIRTVHDYSRG